MKIKDILGEDGITVQSVTGDKAKLSNGTEIDAKTLTPDSAHPGQLTMPQMDPAAIKPGAMVNQGEQSEDMDNDPLAQQYVQQINQFMQQATEPWEKAQLQARLKAVQDGQVPRSANGGAIKQLPPSEWEANLAKTAPSTLVRMLGVFGTSAYSPEYLKQHNMLSRGLDHIGLEEADLTEKKHKDTMAQGGSDIGGDNGGDKGDDFIDDVKDKGYERKNRNPGSGNRGPISGGKLKETDELYKWLTIAGLK